MSAELPAAIIAGYDHLSVEIVRAYTGGPPGIAACPCEA